jgi:uncharacterized protein (DUF1697 family)
MKDLRDLLGDLGFDRVETYIQSGNVVFSTGQAAAKTLAASIEQAIATRMGVTCAVVVLTRSELESAIEANPFPEPDDPRLLHVVFRATDLSAADRKSLDTAAEKARIKAPGSRDEAKAVGRYLYLSTPEGLGRSELAAQLSRGVTGAGTARNWATVQKLEAMLNG